MSEWHKSTRRGLDRGLRAPAATPWLQPACSSSSLQARLPNQKQLVAESSGVGWGGVFFLTCVCMSKAETVCVCVCICMSVQKRGTSSLVFMTRRRHGMAAAGWRREIPLFALPWFQNNLFLPVSAERGKQRFYCVHIFQPLGCVFECKLDWKSHLTDIRICVLTVEMQLTTTNSWRTTVTPYVTWLECNPFLRV